jgi:D-threonine aldolase
VVEKYWYEADNVSDYDSPALFLYPDRIKNNIKFLLDKVEAGKIWPHVKTNKTAEVTILMREAGIHKFKAATIAEAEMLGLIKAPEVLLAYPLTSLKISRLIRLILKYPETRFYGLVDNESTARLISVLFSNSNLRAHVYMDLNVGMNRTGILPERGLKLYELIVSLPALEFSGLHAYDGHIKDPDLKLRTLKCQQAFEPVQILKYELEKHSGSSVNLIAGGSPTCFIHAAAGDREYSAGTFVFWDKHYADQLPEQPFEWAATLVCRVISIPAPDMICVDLGYKSIASESPLPRVYFINEPDAIPYAQSEEHLVLKVPDAGKFIPGHVLYGIPWHICPSVSLYDKAMVVEENIVTGVWDIIARKREITI